LLDCCREKIKPSDLIDTEQVAQSCRDAGLLSDSNVITAKGLAILEEFETYLVKTKKKVATDVLGEGFMEKIKEYREIFPAKRLPSNQLARQSMKELKDNFIWFFKNYPEYDWDLVLDATEYYVHRFSLKNYMYMMTSAYFIKKSDTTTKDVKSSLADHCQMLLDNPNIIYS